MFPLSTVLFPHAELPIHIFEPRYQALVADVMAGSKEFGTVLISAGSEVGGGEKRTNIGTLLRVEMAVPFDDGRWMLVTRGIERIKVLEWLEDDPYPKAIVEPHPGSDFSGGPELINTAAASLRRVRMLLSELDEGPCGPIDIDLSDDPMRASWMACALAPLGLLDAQQLLECTDPVERLTQLIDLCRARITDLQHLLSESGNA